MPGWLETAVGWMLLGALMVALYLAPLGPPLPPPVPAEQTEARFRFLEGQLRIVEMRLRELERAEQEGRRR